MEKTDGSELATGAWEAFTLGMLAPLGPCSEVHLAPKIPPALLNDALRTYLPLEQDELLLALFDSGFNRPRGCCALTTRRIYWVTAAASPPRDGPPSSQGGRWPLVSAKKAAGGSELVCQAANYAALSAKIVPATTEDRSLRLELGVGQPLVLATADLRLGQLLAHYLETVGAAARAGTAPSLAVTDPELATRVARALPAVASVTRQARRMNVELVQFRRALFASTPHALVTPLLVLACVAVFFAMVSSGVSAVRPTAAALLDWGANQGAFVILRRQYWRLLTSVFVHGGLIHLAVNMWCLINIGPLLERLYGNLGYIALYLAAGIGGAIASAATPPPKPSVGASGAIFGVLGALISFLIIHRRSIPATVLRPLRGSAIGFVIFNTIFGLVVPNIDQAAHMGGLVTGFLAGLLLVRPWPAVVSRRVALHRVARLALCALALAGAVRALSSHGERLFAPAIRYEDLDEQLGPAIGEFDAIGETMTRLHLPLRSDAGSPESGVATIQELSERAARNLPRIRRATTPDPELRALVDALYRAQSRQLERLRSTRRYVESGGSQELEEPILVQKIAMEQAVDEFRKRRHAYFEQHGLYKARVRQQP
jgi:rhomboid protease GluP